MSALEDRLQALEQRLQLVEDELAIHRLIVRYGFAVDVGDADRAAAVFAENAVYDVDVRLMQGREEVCDMVRTPRHQGMVGHCAHQIGPCVVRVKGDAAVALGYSRVYLEELGAIRVYRVSYNHWQLERQDGQWRITRRRTRLLGHPEATRVFEDGLAGELEDS